MIANSKSARRGNFCHAFGVMSLMSLFEDACTKYQDKNKKYDEDEEQYLRNRSGTFCDASEAKDCRHNGDDEEDCSPA
jgi:hypothetical protein